MAADRPGLLSWIAGSLALAGLSILTAQVFTTDDGAAVDLFEVEGVFEREIDEARWRDFRRTLRKAVEGRTSLAHRVVEKRRHYPPAIASPVTVRVDNEASEFSSVIEVGAPDRLGLLYDITVPSPTFGSTCIWRKWRPTRTGSSTSSTCATPWGPRWWTPPRSPRSKPRFGLGARTKLTA